MGKGGVKTSRGIKERLSRGGNMGERGSEANSALRARFIDQKK